MQRWAKRKGGSGAAAAGGKAQSHTVYMFFMVQEWCNGGPLSRALSDGSLRATALPHGRLSPVVKLLLGVAAGLRVMHGQRIVHSDLSPAHILLQVRRAAHLAWSPACAVASRLHACTACMHHVRMPLPRQWLAVRGLATDCAVNATKGMHHIAVMIVP